MQSFIEIDLDFLSFHTQNRLGHRNILSKTIIIQRSCCRQDNNTERHAVFFATAEFLLLLHWIDDATEYRDTDIAVYRRRKFFGIVHHCGIIVEVFVVAAQLISLVPLDRTFRWRHYFVGLYPHEKNACAKQPHFRLPVFHFVSCCAVVLNYQKAKGFFSSAHC